MIFETDSNFDRGVYRGNFETRFEFLSREWFVQEFYGPLKKDVSCVSVWVREGECIRANDFLELFSVA